MSKENASKTQMFYATSVGVYLHPNSTRYILIFFLTFDFFDIYIYIYNFLVKFCGRKKLYSNQHNVFDEDEGLCYFYNTCKQFGGAVGKNKFGKFGCVNYFDSTTLSSDECQIG